jgi:hypothetical protein
VKTVDPLTIRSYDPRLQNGIALHNTVEAKSAHAAAADRITGKRLIGVPGKHVKLGRISGSTRSFATSGDESNEEKRASGAASGLQDF